MVEKSRTLQQNKAYWLWLTELSNELVAHGVDMKGTIHVPIMATPELLHKNVTHRLIKTMFDKESTADLTTKEISQVAEIITKTFAERTEGLVNVPFPDKAIENYEEYTKFNQALKDF
jgi:hypothetical protein